MTQYSIPFPSAADVGAKSPRRARIAAAGAVYDLSAIFEDLNLRFFGGTVMARIRWGRRRVPSRRRFKRSRHITLGSYSRRRLLITIHPNLDRDEIPQFFVEAIVYHEMCHEIAGEERAGGRRRLHTPRFKELERGYPMFAEARRWAKENINCLLKSQI